jgi:ectoine hydroxylase
VTTVAPTTDLPALLDLLDRDGIVTLPGVVGPTALERLTDALDRVYAEHARKRAVAADGSLHLLEFLGHDRSFPELVDVERVLRVVAGGLGWNIQVYHSHLDVHPPQRGREPPTWRWHRDGGRQQADLGPRAPRLSLKVAYPLSDLTAPGRGNMLVLPGSHRLGRLKPSAGADPLGAVPVLAAPGSAVVFDPRLWHARGHNRSATTRKLLFLAYSYRWVRPRGDPLAGIDATELDPLRRQLLGGAASEHGHWFPREEDVPLRRWIESRPSEVAC